MNRGIHLALLAAAGLLVPSDEELPPRRLEEQVPEQPPTASVLEDHADRAFSETDRPCTHCRTMRRRLREARENPGRMVRLAALVRHGDELGTALVTTNVEGLKAEELVAVCCDRGHVYYRATVRGGEAAFFSQRQAAELWPEENTVPDEVRIRVETLEAADVADLAEGDLLALGSSGRFLCRIGIEGRDVDEWSAEALQNLLGRVNELGVRTFGEVAVELHRMGVGRIAALETEERLRYAKALHLVDGLEALDERADDA